MATTAELVIANIAGRTDGAAKSTTDADKVFGFTFGVDGVYSRKEACEKLGGCSIDTLESLCTEGRLRRGKLPGHRPVVICKRSLHEYLRQAEQ